MTHAGFSTCLDRELLIGRMRKALNDAYVPLSDEAACHAAYRAAGIGEYDEAEHNQAVDYARRWREQPQNIARRLAEVA